MKINIFIPVYYRFKATKKSLESIIPCVLSSVYNCNLFIGINGYENEEMKNWLISLEQPNVHVFLSDKNIGKAGIVNRIYDAHGTDCDYIISIDSDMIWESNDNFIDQMVWAMEHFTDFGLLSSFQLENDQQIWSGLTKEITIENVTVAYGRYNNVAGGCIILHKKLWESVEKYSTYGGVYGFDDGLLMQSVHDKEKLTGVLKDTKFIHPFDENEEYKNWKSENIRKRKIIGYFEKNN